MRPLHRVGLRIVSRSLRPFYSQQITYFLEQFSSELGPLVAVNLFRDPVPGEDVVLQHLNSFFS
jgi:hypothetical protein